MAKKMKIDRKTLRSFQQAKNLLIQGNTQGWDDALQQLHFSAPGDESLTLLIADEYQQNNQLEKAITTLQTFLSVSAPTAPIFTMISSVAMSLEQYDLAIKVLAQLTEIQPEESSHYVNIAACLRKQGHELDSLNFIMQIMGNFPNKAAVWDALANLLEINSVDPQFSISDTYKECVSMLGFEVGHDIRQLISYAYEKALELNSTNFNTLNNYANFLGKDKKATTLYERAIRLDPDHPQPNVGLAIKYLTEGRLKEAWPLYEFRRKEGQGLAKNFELKADLPEWKGEFDPSASLLICGEQGLGDEILFFLNLPKLIKEMGQIYVGCDPRLVEILRRSFPEIKVAPYEDIVEFVRRKRAIPEFDAELTSGGIDYQIVSGSIPQFMWAEVENIPDVTSGFFASDPQRDISGVDQLDKSKPIIGISWRSSNMSEGRSAGYWGLDSIKSLLEVIDAQFVSLQYDALEEELEALGEYSNFHAFPDIDLRDDLEANLVLMDRCELVIGPPTATQMLSFALGRPTWLPCMGSPWYAFGQKGQFQLPYAKHMTLFDGEDQALNSIGYWQNLVMQIGKKIGADTSREEQKRKVNQKSTPSSLGDETLALFIMGSYKHEYLETQLRWHMGSQSDQLVFLNNFLEQKAHNDGTPYWTDLPLEKQLKAKVLYGPGANWLATSAIKAKKDIRYGLFLSDVESSIRSQYSHHLFTNPDTPSGLDQFIEENTYLVSQAHRLLKDFLGWEESRANQVFEPEHQDLLFLELKNTLDKFTFIGLCDDRYHQDIQHLCHYLGFGDVKNSKLTPKNSFGLVEKEISLQKRDAYPSLAVDFKLIDYVMELHRKRRGPFLDPVLNG